MDTRIYSLRLNIILYMIASVIGTVLIHISLDNISKWLKEDFLKDRFNLENESFEQCEEEINDKYSVNIPMRYYWKGKFRKGSINITNPFRGTLVVGTPGSGKTFSVIEPFIRQHSKKGFAMVVYDYKWPTLAQKLYYAYCKNKKTGALHGAKKHGSKETGCWKPKHSWRIIGVLSLQRQEASLYPTSTMDGIPLVV